MNNVVYLLITDLDNTLYDWMSSFVPSFYGMVEVAAKLLFIDKERLLDELKEVHQRYGNSEQPFALLETPIVEKRYPNTSKLERKYKLGEAFHAFNKIRKQNLCLYPGVRETIQLIRSNGCIVVGYTEAVVENSLYRLKLLNLVEEIQHLYAPKSRVEGHPDPTKPSMLDGLTDYVCLLPYGHRKPDPAVLKNICTHHNTLPEKAVYIGDNLTRDVAMAKAAGVHAVWARYGYNSDTTMWDKLVRVTHWTDEDVLRENRLRKQYHDVQPELILDSFSELLMNYEFRSED